MRHAVIGLAVLGVLVLGIGTALAVETFTKPTYKGDRLAWCRKPGSGCGAADAYCAYLGFADTTDYSKDANIGDKSPTRFIGNNLVCDRKGCDGFKTITCGKKEQPAPEKKKTYDKPRYKGFRLDWCVSKGSGCGKPAANKFCRSEGYDKASAFAPELRIGIGDPTRMIGSGAICNTVLCNGFQSITCVK